MEEFEFFVKVWNFVKWSLQEITFEFTFDNVSWIWKSWQNGELAVKLSLGGIIAYGIKIFKFSTSQKNYFSD